MGYGQLYRERAQALGYCPIEANSDGYQGEPLRRTPPLHMLLADFECPVCGELPGDCAHGRTS